MVGCRNLNFFPFVSLFFCHLLEGLLLRFEDARQTGAYQAGNLNNKFDVELRVFVLRNIFDAALHVSGENLADVNGRPYFFFDIGLLPFFYCFLPLQTFCSNLLEVASLPFLVRKATQVKVRRQVVSAAKAP